MLKALVLIMNLIVAGTLINQGEGATAAVQETGHLLLGLFLIVGSLTILWSKDPSSGSSSNLVS